MSKWKCKESCQMQNNDCKYGCESDKHLIECLITHLEQANEKPKVHFSEVVSGFDTAEFIQDYERKIKSITDMLNSEDIYILDKVRLQGKKSAYEQVIQDIKSRCQNV